MINVDEGYYGCVEDFFELEWNVPEFDLRFYQGQNVEYVRGEINYFVHNPLFTFPREIFSGGQVQMLRFRLLHVSRYVSDMDMYPLIQKFELGKLLRRELLSMNSYYRRDFQSCLWSEIENYRELYTRLHTIKNLLDLMLEQQDTESRFLITFFILQRWMESVKLEFRDSYFEEFQRASYYDPVSYDFEMLCISSAEDVGIY
jgi:hypothetical protein